MTSEEFQALIKELETQAARPTRRAYTVFLRPDEWAALEEWAQFKVEDSKHDLDYCLEELNCAMGIDATEDAMGSLKGELDLAAAARGLLDLVGHEETRLV